MKIKGLLEIDGKVVKTEFEVTMIRLDEVKAIICGKPTK